MVEWWSCKRNLLQWGKWNVVSVLGSYNCTRTNWKNYMQTKKSTSLTWTVCFPLQTNNRVLCSRSLISACLKPEAIPPSSGIIQGLKYERNFSVSFPCTSRYWTARPPRAASSSTVLIAAVPASSYILIIMQFVSLLVHKLHCKKMDELILWKQTWLVSLPSQ